MFKSSQFGNTERSSKGLGSILSSRVSRQEQEARHVVQNLRAVQRLQRVVAWRCLQRSSLHTEFFKARSLWQAPSCQARSWFVRTARLLHVDGVVDVGDKQQPWCPVTVHQASQPVPHSLLLFSGAENSHCECPSRV